MSDRATIEIDCDAECVKVSFDQQNMPTIGHQMETTRASLIAQILAPEIRKLMGAKKSTLMQMHLAAIKNGDDHT